MVCRATMATMASELVGNQCRPDLLDAPITIILTYKTKLKLDKEVGGGVLHE